LHPYVCPASASVPDLEKLILKAKSFISRAKSPATLKAYRNDWREFESWCRAHAFASPRGLHKDLIGKILKRAAARAGMDVAPFGGHSLRAGCVKQAAMNGVPERIIMKQTGHKTVATLRKYIRSGEIFRDNAAAGLGL